MRIRFAWLAFIILCVSPLGAIASSNPIPGVGIVVKRPPGSSTAFVIPGGFFGAGSSPFSGTVGMEGRCSHDCGGCDNNCAGNEDNPDGRMDFSYDVETGPFTITMPAMTLHVIEEIEYLVETFPYKVRATARISGPDPSPDDPVTGVFNLQAGEALYAGGWGKIDNSELPVHCTITFFDDVTGLQVGGVIEQDLLLTLQGSDVPVARAADGTPSGRMVMGSDLSSIVPFTYASADGELSIKMLSLYTTGPVATEGRTWGGVKALYR
jgi:hypothetical protein